MNPTQPNQQQLENIQQMLESMPNLPDQLPVSDDGGGKFHWVTNPSERRFKFKQLQQRRNANKRAKAARKAQRAR